MTKVRCDPRNQLQIDIFKQESTRSCKNVISFQYSLKEMIVRVYIDLILFADLIIVLPRHG